MIKSVRECFSVLVVLMTLPACITLTVLLIKNSYTRLPFAAGYLAWAVWDMKLRKGLASPWWCGKMKSRMGIEWLVKGVRSYFGGAKIKFIDKKAVESIKGPTIFGCHPHGIFGISTLINFGFGAHVGGIATELPGSKLIHVLTLRLSFFIPFWRDLLVRFGLGPVDKKTCRRVLREAEHSIAVVLGGAREALNSRPGHYEIILKKRTGLFKIAIEEQKMIIPTFSFGDVDLYEQISLPWPLKHLQTLSMYLVGFSLPIPRGRFGTILPFRRDLFTVVGRPIDPRGKSVEELQTEYIKGLQEIYELNAPKNSSELIIK